MNMCVSVYMCVFLCVYMCMNVVYACMCVCVYVCLCVTYANIKLALDASIYWYGEPQGDGCKEVDIGVVECEINEYGTSLLIDPIIVSKFSNDIGGLISSERWTQDEVKGTAAIIAFGRQEVFRDVSLIIIMPLETIVLAVAFARRWRG